jgi:hypothetical protein
MSFIQWADTKPTPDYAVAKKRRLLLGMGLTAEAVATIHISRRSR